MLDETKSEAARGNPKAIAELPQVEEIEDFDERFEAAKLRSPDQLPEIDGDSLALERDMESVSEA